MTSYFNWRIHNSNYKKDYYKKLLDKRIEAYENLNMLANSMSDLVDTENGIVHGILCSKFTYNNFKTEIYKTMSKSFWLDNVTQNKLTELSAFLFNEIDKNIDDNWSEDVQNKKYSELSVKHFEKMQDFKKTIKYFLNNELKNLYKLDDFFNDNRDENKSHPVYSNKIKNE